jgi:hypothetical protein
MIMENEFISYHLRGSLEIKKGSKKLATLFNTDNIYLSEFKAIHKYKDLVWDIQGAIDNCINYNNTKVYAKITLYGMEDGTEKVIRQQTFN